MRKHHATSLLFKEMLQTASNAEDVYVFSLASEGNESAKLILEAKDRKDRYGGYDTILKLSQEGDELGVTLMKRRKEAYEDRLRMLEVNKYKGELMTDYAMRL